jgi:hypothetical protein
MSRNCETGHYNSVTDSFLGTHKWEPDIYIGFLPALYLQCGTYGIRGTVPLQGKKMVNASLHPPTKNSHSTNKRVHVTKSKKIPQGGKKPSHMIKNRSVCC